MYDSAMYGMTNGGMQGGWQGGWQSGMNGSMVGTIGLVNGMAKGGWQGMNNGGWQGMANGGWQGGWQGGTPGFPGGVCTMQFPTSCGNAQPGGPFPGGQGQYWNQAGGWGNQQAYQQNMYAAAGGQQLQQYALAQQFGVAGNNAAMYGVGGNANFGATAAFMPPNIGAGASFYVGF